MNGATDRELSRLLPLGLLKIVRNPSVIWTVSIALLPFSPLDLKVKDDNNIRIVIMVKHNSEK